MCSPEYMSFSSCSNSSSMVCIAMRLPPVSEANAFIGLGSLLQAGLQEPCLRYDVRDARALEQAGERNVCPVGSVVQLIAKLVQRLVEREKLQQRFDIGRACRQECGTTRRHQIRTQARRAHPRLPRLRPWREPLEVLMARGGGGAQPGERRIAERAKHPGHIAERRGFGAALGEGTRRLTLEIQDHHVA